MAQDPKPSVFIVIHEDGTHTNLTRDVQPDIGYVGRVEKTLASQGRRGVLVKLEGDIRTDGTITHLQDINLPSAAFEAIKAAFVRKHTNVSRRANV